MSSNLTIGALDYKAISTLLVNDNQIIKLCPAKRAAEWWNVVIQVSDAWSNLKCI
jgi:hypothetical protein